MKRQLTKKLSAFIVTAMMFSVNLNAQSQTGNVQSPPTDDPNNIVVACNCSKPGWGCFSGSWACMMACSIKCRKHLPAVDGGSNFSETPSLTDVVSNPVSNSTTVSFYLDQPEKVSLRIFDLDGNLVKTLADNSFEVGEHAVSWNSKSEKGEGVATGVYALKVDVNNYSENKKIIVVK